MGPSPAIFGVFGTFIDTDTKETLKPLAKIWGMSQYEGRYSLQVSIAAGLLVPVGQPDELRESWQPET